MKKPRKILYEIFVLIVPVMLGVYLGLLANNWSKEKEDKLQTEKVLNNILQEIKYNEVTTQESLKYFRQLRDSIFLLDNRNSLPSDFTFWKGLNPPLLKNASFQSASLSGLLSRFDLDLLEQLSSVYKLQDDLELQSNTYIQSVTNKIGDESFNNNKYLIILENYAHDQISTEENLFQELSKAKKMISKKLNYQ
ncbi:hypothetical protein PP182_07685 [Maribacter sp. PR1]|uniref:Uncharacterized protein n=1 Tax=Maribacter cobaltidurans TaxID=1178778 RepID=A0ABU7ITJ6_9FLAO|nr:MULTISPECIES: hypothetical protein [Maribacter]MDC6388559.1 hypothetical protein [Maribacter sp. PR1]MEE1975948.1 hypothetical protein [Maribacter cobaltidurans]